MDDELKGAQGRCLVEGMEELGLEQDAAAKEVKQLEMQVDSEEYSLSVAGEKLPHIERLKLNESKVPLIRDLGTSWKNLKVLWLSRCGLEDVHGLNALPNLRELYISFNDLSDITPIADLEYIEVVDLESNRVEDMDSIEYLGMCRGLTQLTLEGNAVCSQKGYRNRIASQMPQLQILDDVVITEEERHYEENDQTDDSSEGQTQSTSTSGTCPSKPASLKIESQDQYCGPDGQSESCSSDGVGVLTEAEELEKKLKSLENAELALISDGIKYTRIEPRDSTPMCYIDGNDAVLSVEELFKNFEENLPLGNRLHSMRTSRPASAGGFRSSSSSFSRSLADDGAAAVSSSMQLSTSASGRRSVIVRPSTAGPRGHRTINHKIGSHSSKASAGDLDVSSKLTRGGDCSLAGNAAKALLQRKSQQQDNDSSGSDSEDDNNNLKSESSGSDHQKAEGKAASGMDMLEELKKWKLSHSNDAFSSVDEVETRVTYQCLNLDVESKKKREESNSRISRPSIPPQVKHLKSVVIRDENVPVQVNRAVIPAQSMTVSYSSATLEEQYNHYQERHVEDFQCFDAHAPVPPKPQGSSGFQRRTIIRKGGIKVERNSRRAVVAARRKRFGTKTKGGEGLQTKIQHGAENW